MRFAFATVVAAAFAGSAIATAVDASDIVATIQGLVNSTTTLIPYAQQITSQNAPETVYHQGPWWTVLTGINDMILTLDKSVVALKIQGKPSFNETDASSIAASFTPLTSALSKLVNIVTLKAPFLKTIPIVGPLVSAAFTQLDSSIDAFAQLTIAAVNGTAPTPITNGLSTVEDSFSKLATAFKF